MVWYVINGFMAIFLVVTLFRIVVELKEVPVPKGRVAFEVLWAVVLTAVLLNNFGFLP